MFRFLPCESLGVVFGASLGSRGEPFGEIASGRVEELVIFSGCLSDHPFGVPSGDPSLGGAFSNHIYIYIYYYIFIWGVAGCAWGYLGLISWSRSRRADRFELNESCGCRFPF